MAWCQPEPQRYWTGLFPGFYSRLTTGVFPFVLNWSQRPIHQAAPLLVQGDHVLLALTVTLRKTGSFFWAPSKRRIVGFFSFFSYLVNLTSAFTPDPNMDDICLDNTKPWIIKFLVVFSKRLFCYPVLFLDRKYVRGSIMSLRPNRQ